jgi:hypothetical protein
MRMWSPLARVASFGTVLVLPIAVSLAPVAPAAVVAGVTPNAVNMLDCNGHSPTYQTLKATMGALCADPFFNEDGVPERAYDNGKYIGHDEPSVKFVSSAHGSGNHMTYFMQLAVDPAAAPTADGSVSHYAELSIAPWFGLPMCDPKSYPQQPCKPDSDANTGLGSKQDAGSAFMELQFYPPGFGPFKDAFSCDQTQYCAALTIDSLSCSFGFKFCNPNCFEPVNFAYLQRDGIPTGPPSPQLATDATFAPNSETLKMNQGDKLRVELQDTPDGFLTSVQDLTTGQTGSMEASIANGFMDTNPRSCVGYPFAFHPEYDTAAPQNQVPWAALEGGVLMQQEIGHGESCGSVSNQVGLGFDQQTFWNCNGGLDTGAGEGPCDFSTGVCQNPTTEGGGPCPAGAGACEFSDALCMPQGSRTVIISGQPTTWAWPVAFCEQDITQNGDLDFDGNGYRAEWPDGSSNHPTPFRYAGPFLANGDPYPSIQFETDLAASENDCNVVNGDGCTAPPHGAQFYPFWSIGNQASITGGRGSACLWNFGNTIRGVTTNSFGGAAEYGAPDVARFAGTIITPVIPNPQLAGCSRH